jgi:sec-independent protein translocase protein TatB
MPSFQDSAVIFFLALLLFGPKKLPELARYVGKLMGEFRRASSEFRLQMEDEFRLSEQAEQQKKIAALDAAAPATPALDHPEPEQHPHIDPPLEIEPNPTPELNATAIEPIPIASNGDLHMMPPSTGLPIGGRSNSSSSSSFDFVPRAPAPDSVPAPEPEVTHNA